MRLELQFFGGRGSSGGNNPKGSAANTKQTAIPKKVTSANATSDMLKKIATNPSSVSKGTVIEQDNGTSYKAEGNGLWKRRTPYDTGYKTIKATNFYPNNREGGTYAENGYTDQQTAEAIIKDSLKNWSKQLKKRK